MKKPAMAILCLFCLVTCIAGCSPKHDTPSVSAQYDAIPMSEDLFKTVMTNAACVVYCENTLSSFNSYTGKATYEFQLIEVLKGELKVDALHFEVERVHWYDFKKGGKYILPLAYLDDVFNTGYFLKGLQIDVGFRQNIKSIRSVGEIWDEHDYQTLDDIKDFIATLPSDGETETYVPKTSLAESLADCDVAFRVKPIKKDPVEVSDAFDKYFVKVLDVFKGDAIPDIVTVVVTKNALEVDEEYILLMERLADDLFKITDRNYSIYAANDTQRMEELQQALADIEAGQGLGK